MSPYMCGSLTVGSFDIQVCGHKWVSLPFLVDIRCKIRFDSHIGVKIRLHDATKRQFQARWPLGEVPVQDIREGYE